MTFFSWRRCGRRSVVLQGTLTRFVQGCKVGLGVSIQIAAAEGMHIIRADCLVPTVPITCAGPCAIDFWVPWFPETLALRPSFDRMRQSIDHQDMVAPFLHMQHTNFKCAPWSTDRGLSTLAHRCHAAYLAPRWSPDSLVAHDPFLHG